MGLSMAASETETAIANCRKALTAREYGGDARQSSQSQVEELGEKVEGAKARQTFAILALKKDLTRNLNRSSSVWITMRPKFVPASMRAVDSSMASIFLCRMAR